MGKKNITIFLVLLLPTMGYCNELVFCIHGFLGSRWNMVSLEKSLQKEGWDVINWQYPSRNYHIIDHGVELAYTLASIARQQPTIPIHFVTHSMGGLVLLAALNHPICPQEAKEGKLVLIAPPIKGSSCARILSELFFTSWIVGKASGQEFLTKQEFSELGEFPCSLQGILVIAGNGGINPLLKKENDGLLTLEETELPIPHERVIVPCDHNTIVFCKKVKELVCGFLQKNH